jgi:hypothetical protein
MLYFWPAELLPANVPTASIITWGYATHSIKAFDCSSRIVWAGILVKKALLQSKDSNQVDIAPITSDTRGVIFMGTPYCGPKRADFAACLL